MLNTKDDLGATYKGAVVDKYAEKVLLSRYSREQTVRIVKNGIKGYEGKRKRRLAEGRPLRNTAALSIGSRNKKKLLAKSNWFKKRSNKGSNDKYQSNGKAKKSSHQQRELETKTVLFVEYTEGGELASRLRELMKRLAPALGFNIKVVERAGAALKQKFPVTNLWDNAKCGRSSCVTCEQGTESIQPCYKSNLVYENVCKQCNTGAVADKEQEKYRNDIPRRDQPEPI